MKRVVVTGGAAGIGLAMARAFLEDGAKVAICDMDPEAVASFALEHPACIAQVADVTDEISMDRFLALVEAQWGGADVVCANAGTGGPAGQIENLDYEEWQKCIATNLFGAFLTCRWAAKVMRAQGSGVILLTSSTAGTHGYPLRSPYAAAKWGIVGLTKTLAMELGDAGVRVNTICPGSVTGDRMERVLANEAKARGTSTEVVRQSYVKGVSMKTWVSAEDVAASALFLASDGARKISGQILAVDGSTETLAT